MEKWRVEYETSVDVEVDEAKFTPEFMEEFRKHFYEFNTIQEHVEHIGQLAARGLIDNSSFIEGYGLAKDFGIEITVSNASFTNSEKL